MEKEPAVILLFSSVMGSYIPESFVSDEFFRKNFGLNETNSGSWEPCLNKDSDKYWDAWEWIKSNSRYKSALGDFIVYQYKGNVWALDVDRMTVEEKENFEWGTNYGNVRNGNAYYADDAE